MPLEAFADSRALTLGVELELQLVNTHDYDLTHASNDLMRLVARHKLPGEVKPDWWIICEIARRMYAHDAFAYANPAAIFREHAALSAYENEGGRVFDLAGLAGIDDKAYESLSSVQWPVSGTGRGTARLFGDGRFATSDGRARFVAVRQHAPAHATDAAGPMILNTGRLRDQWHGMSRTGTAAQLFGHVDQAQLSLHPDDLERRSLSDGQLVKVTSRRGELILPVLADDQLQPGQAFIPMHWGDRYLKGLGVNVLTQPAFDPLSRQPELKHSGVDVQPVALDWTLFVLVEGDVQQRFDALRPLCEQFDYASFALTGRERPALLIHAAHTAAPDAAWMNNVDRLLGLDEGAVLVYDDPGQSVGKRIRIDQGRITAIRLTGEAAARDWLRGLWERGEVSSPLQRWFLAPLASPPGGAASMDRTLCNCMNVSVSRIRPGVEDGLDRRVKARRGHESSFFSGLKEQLGCGTQCGSCVPEIKRMLATHVVTA